jgi:hypothetical protein
MGFKGFDRMKKAMDKVQELQEKNSNEMVEVDNKKKPVKVIRAGDMSPETKALPDEVAKPPKGIGSSEPDMKKGGMVKKYSKGGTASSRADGIAVKGKTRGKIC